MWSARGRRIIADELANVRDPSQLVGWEHLDGAGRADVLTIRREVMGVPLARLAAGERSRGPEGARIWDW